MKNTFLISLILVILSGFIYAQLLFPWKELSNSKKDILDELNLTLGHWETIQLRRDELLSRFNNIPQEKVVIIQNAVLEYSSENVTIILIALDDLIRRSNLPLNTKYVLGREITETDTIRLPITFNFNEINYNILREFLSNIQLWDRGVKITSVSINAIQDFGKQNANFVKATINLDSLFSNKINTNI